MRRSLAALILLLPACSVPAEEARIWSVPAMAAAPSDAAAELLGVIELRGLSAEFGGFSGLEVSADGQRIVAVGDRSAWLEAGLRRDDGRLTGVTDARLVPILQRGERPSVAQRDAEGLAMETLNAPRFVSFEQVWRVGRFEDAHADETPVAKAPEWEGRGGNDALEALALAPDGRLLAIRERRDEDPFDAFEGWWIDPESGATSRFEIPRIDAYVATGADFGPDGRLYLLVRTFSNLLGFRFAIQRFRLNGDALVDGEVLVRIAGEGSDNAEGIAAWRDDEGRIRLLVIADDNFNMIQRTLLYEFAVRE